APLATWALLWPFWTPRRYAIGPAYPSDLARCERPTEASMQPFGIEARGNLLVSLRWRQLAHACYGTRIRLAHFPRSTQARDIERRQRSRLPAERDGDDGVAARQGHIFDQAAQQLFALRVGGRRGVPDGWHILRQCQNALTLFGANRTDGVGAPRGVLPLQVFKVGQFLIPCALQRACDQAVFRLHRDIAAAGQVKLILGPFPAQVPLA